jgi:hypothetical protein
LFSALDGGRQLVGINIAVKMFPRVLDMADYEDKDLQDSAKVIFSLMAYSSLNSRHLVRELMSSILRVIADPKPTWHIKTRALAIVQVLYFSNLFLLGQALAKDVLRAVADLLEESPSVEVRTLASATLSGLVRCSQRDSIESLKVC